MAVTVRRETDKRVKSLQQRYKDDHNQKVPSVLLLFTPEQYVYLDRYLNDYPCWRAPSDEVP